jgi:hypothetical protein
MTETYTVENGDEERSSASVDPPLITVADEDDPDELAVIVGPPFADGGAPVDRAAVVPSVVCTPATKLASCWLLGALELLPHALVRTSAAAAAMREGEVFQHTSASPFSRAFA